LTRDTRSPAEQEATALDTLLRAAHASALDYCPVRYLPRRIAVSLDVRAEVADELDRITQAGLSRGVVAGRGAIDIEYLRTELPDGFARIEVAFS
jgi:hypothetical protein